MLVPDIELSNLADEEFLIYRAKELRQVNFSASKSWLITAQVLYPNDFRVQFEVYLIEKAAKNVREAAKCLGNLINEFTHEPPLFKEIDDIMKAVQASSSLFDEGDSDPSLPPSTTATQLTAADDTPFLTQLFYALQKDIQRALVLNTAKRCTDTMSHCSLLLLLTSQFPETTSQQAPTLVERLLSAEQLSPGPLNPYRKKLVCSVLPVLVSGDGGSLEMPAQMLHHLMCLALEYYTALLYSDPATIAAAAAASAAPATPPAKPGLRASGDDDPATISAWRGMFDSVRQLGGRLGWSLARHLTYDSNREVVLQRVQAAMKTMVSGAQLETEETVMELLYVTTTLFLHALYEYTRNVAKDNSGGSTVGVTLVEAFTSPTVAAAGGSRSSSVCSDDLDVLSPPRPKRHRTSQDNDALVPYVSVGQGDGVCGAGLAQALTTAIKCWDLLHSHSKLRTEFSSLLERLSLGGALRLFTTDMLMHDARLTEASRDLRHMLTQVKQEGGATDGEAAQGALVPLPFSQLEICLKLSTVNYALNNLSGAAEAALEVIRLLPPPSSTAPPCPTTAQPPAPHHPAPPAPTLTIAAAGVERHLHLLPLSRAHCLQLVVTLLINALRTRVLLHKFHDDLSIGHLVTLLQFEWPKHESIFLEVVAVLVKQGGLTYEQFPLYMTTPEIIEELVFLHTRDGGGLHLDIVPLQAHVSKQQRTVSTRGADRGSKHDFKLAMRKLMLRCDESVAQNIVTFLTNDGHSIHQNLM